MGSGLNWVDGWNRLIAVVPSNVLTFMTVLGVVILVISVVIWLWQRRKGGGAGMQGFPWIAVVLAGALAGPQLVIPAIIGVLQFVVGFVITIVNSVVR